MMFVRSKNPGDFCYFLANKECFFHRFADSGFRTKWTGFWGKEKKFIEYFAVKVDGEWLHSGNLEKTEYSFSKAVHHYRTKAGTVREIIFIPVGTDALAVEIECEKEARIELKLAVNIRLLGENETPRKYDVQEKDGTITVRNEIGTVFFSSAGLEQKFSHNEKYETHEPSGERQSYFLPGKITFTGKKAAFSVGPEYFEIGGFREALKHREEHDSGHLKDMLKTNSRILSDGFNSAVLGMEMLNKKNGYYAGLPWFQHFWGRDSLWSLPALVYLGHHDQARKTLEYFAHNSDNMCIPNFVSEGMGKAFNSIDATLLWLIGLECYVKNSGDLEFLEEMRMYIKGFLSFLFARDKSGFLEHDFDRNETWMDTQKRPGKAVEIQALYFRALKSSAFIFALLRDDAIRKDVEKRMSNLERLFDKEFFSGGFYADRLDYSGMVRKKTANALVPLIFGLGKKWKEVLGIVESEKFVCKKGIRTLASDEPGFNPSGYHNGSAWSLTTAWAAAAEFACGRPEKGWEFMVKLMEDTDYDALGCIGECWDSDTSKLTGCSLQLWGEALVIRLLDEFMLGIDIDALNGTIRVSPRLPEAVKSVERVRTIGDKKVLLRFRRTGDEVAVTCSEPAVKLIKA